MNTTFIAKFAPTTTQDNEIQQAFKSRFTT